ncbi:MAG TPA: hypothetical protein V6D30_04295 [Leptolyngbyaceae cyanobacterium]
MTCFEGLSNIIQEFLAIAPTLQQKRSLPIALNRGNSSNQRSHFLVNRQTNSSTASATFISPNET